MRSINRKHKNNKRLNRFERNNREAISNIKAKANDKDFREFKKTVRIRTYYPGEHIDLGE